MKIIKKTVGISIASTMFIFFSCTNIQEKPYTLLNADIIYNNPDNYIASLARIYSTFQVTGQTGPAGKADITGFDEGFTNYVRLYWNMQTLPTEESVCGWTDEGVSDMHGHTWSTSNGFVRVMYERISLLIAISNEFLRETTSDKLNGRSTTTDAVRANVAIYRAEARFLRALSYWHLLDLFGNIPLIKESDIVSPNSLPSQAAKQDVFNFIESELLAIIPTLIDSKTVYGRVDKATAQMVLAKLYMNAQTYTGKDRNADALTYCNTIINSGIYSLVPKYRNLFSADNNTNGAQNEIIFAVQSDAAKTRTWGSTTFLIRAAIGGSMLTSDYGILGGGWGGLRTTSQFVDLFPSVLANEIDANVVAANVDKRAIFYTKGQSKTISSITDFTNGYAIPKYTNKKADGTNGTQVDETPDTDFPMFRYADVLLMKAELLLRTNGSATDALTLVNQVRQRAYTNGAAIPVTAGNLSAVTLDDILAERGRELYWEGHRRTDRIRFGQYSDKGIWEWKGNVASGKITDAYRNLYPIPSVQLTANPKLKQNPGY